MEDYRILPAVTLIIAILLSAGCMQPESAPVPNAETTHATAVPHSATIPSGTPPLVLPDLTGPAGSRVSLSAATTSVPKTVTTTPETGQSMSNGFQRYTGAEYSLEYPGEWTAAVTRLPLNEYHHTMQGCFASPAYNLDREVRTFTAPDGRTIFSAVIVSTDRDIWPRNLHGDVVYADLVNSILGNPDACANSPEGAFTIAGISQVPLNGVSYTGVRADFASINATGFTKGTGSIWVVTGRSNRAVFLFYRSSESTVQSGLADYLFGSLRLDPEF